MSDAPRPMTEHPSPVTPQTEAGRSIWADWMLDTHPDRRLTVHAKQARLAILAIEREAADAARKEVLDEILAWFDRYAKPGSSASVWSYEGNRGDSLETILDSLARPVEEETPEQKRIRNAPEHSEEGWSR